MSTVESTIALFLRKIEQRQPLSDDAREAFLALPASGRTYATYRDIVREGETVERCALLGEGLVSRYKTLKNGGRQINSFHFPGDMVDLESSLMTQADHGIRTHVPTTIVHFKSSDVLGLVAEHPQWGRALWFDTLIDSGIFREWMLNVGRRTAVARIAHLLLEFAYRLKAIGQCDGRKFVMPVTQVDLADAAGLSAVHTNRLIQRLREDGLIRTYGKTVVIERPEEMIEIAGFDSRYLHPEGPRQLAAAA